MLVVPSLNFCNTFFMLVALEMLHVEFPINWMFNDNLKVEWSVLLPNSKSQLLRATQEIRLCHIDLYLSNECISQNEVWSGSNGWISNILLRFLHFDALVKQLTTLQNVTFSIFSNHKSVWIIFHCAAFFNYFFACIRIYHFNVDLIITGTIPKNEWILQGIVSIDEFL